jgi:hypothetical protein
MDKQTEKKSYQTPKLEQEKSFIAVTGLSLPIGSVLNQDEGVLE